MTKKSSGIDPAELASLQGVSSEEMTQDREYECYVEKVGRWITLTGLEWQHSFLIEDVRGWNLCVGDVTEDVADQINDPDICEKLAKLFRPHLTLN